MPNQNIRQLLNQMSNKFGIDIPENLQTYDALLGIFKKQLNHLPKYIKKEISWKVDGLDFKEEDHLEYSMVKKLRNIISQGYKHHKLIQKFSNLFVNLPEEVPDYDTIYKAIKNSPFKKLPKEIRNQFLEELAGLDIKENDPLNYQTTKAFFNILENYALKHAEKMFEGKLDFVFQQSTIIGDFRTKNVKNGICSPITIKWIEAKLKDTDFKIDWKNPEHRDWFQWAVEDHASNPLLYLKSEKIHPKEPVLTKVDLTTKDWLKGGAALMGVDNTGKTQNDKDGLGHSCGVLVDFSKGRFEFFDPNTGQFSFQSKENLKQFIEFYIVQTYYENKNDCSNNLDLSYFYDTNKPTLSPYIFQKLVELGDKKANDSSASPSNT
ncbi:YopT-type cysteine protease domain-containing protein [Facilibium subflavum]|uniref:YopT-type cysteine protease domain-containing protein n=1 Tax=Facilibium subflavum TaxID=2219058 RepID=UPI000E646C08|nr:YopT-type cysteine protease domain-containing protein [Facilibium subflavum]